MIIDYGLRTGRWLPPASGWARWGGQAAAAGSPAPCQPAQHRQIFLVGIQIFLDTSHLEVIGPAEVLVESAAQTETAIINLHLQFIHSLLLTFLENFSRPGLLQLYWGGLQAPWVWVKPSLLWFISDLFLVTGKCCWCSVLFRSATNEYENEKCWFTANIDKRSQ